jgi:hypothetical protein
MTDQLKEHRVNRFDPTGGRNQNKYANDPARVGIVRDVSIASAPPLRREMPTSARTPARCFP